MAALADVSHSDVKSWDAAYGRLLLRGGREAEVRRTRMDDGRVRRFETGEDKVSHNGRGHGRAS